jgi:AraC-like DNA-binding protein
MDRAYERLNKTDESIARVAFDAGYDHPSNFATAFKRVFGVSPRAVRGH